MDAYLEEELYDLLIACIKDPNAAAAGKERIAGIGRELHADGGVDAMENMFFSIEHRIKEEISADALPYRAWWNGIDGAWKY